MSDLEVYSGEVVWFQYVYGFIAWEKEGVSQPDMFAHFSDVVLEGFKLLKAGQYVTFTIGANNEGRPKATDIRIISTPVEDLSSMKICTKDS